MKILEIRAESAVKRAESVLAGTPKAVLKAVPRAINRALIAGRTQVVKEVTSKYTVRAGDVRNDLRLVRSKPNSAVPVGEIRISGQNLPARAFKHSPRIDDTTGGNRRKVSVSISRGRKEQLLKAFKWKGHIFERTGKFKKGNSDRIHETIKKRHGVSVAGMAETGSKAVRERMQEVFEARLDHEVRAIIEGKAK